MFIDKLQVMPRDRFLALHAFWHLNDNTFMGLPTDEDYDKLYKIRPLYNHLRDIFPCLYAPGENLAVDESMVPWRGRVAWRQFIANKPVRYGMKLYFLCESGSGYILKMKMYTGKEGNVREINHGPNVVLDLVKEYYGKNHIIYSDSFFTNFNLVRVLRNNETFHTGTVIKNRKGNPPDIKTVKLKKGETVTRQKGDIVCVRYHDRKDVMLLSSRFTAEPVATGKEQRLTAAQRRSGEIAQPVKKPNLVHMYNQNMNAVDQFDQHLSFYSMNRKTVKWWKRCATHFLHIAKVQAMILHNKNEEKKYEQLEFTLALITALCDSGAGVTSDVAEAGDGVAGAVAAALADAGVVGVGAGGDGFSSNFVS